MTREKCGFATEAHKGDVSFLLYDGGLHVTHICLLLVALILSMTISTSLFNVKSSFSPSLSFLYKNLHCMNLTMKVKYVIF